MQTYTRNQAEPEHISALEYVQTHLGHSDATHAQLRKTRNHGQTLVTIDYQLAHGQQRTIATPLEIMETLGLEPGQGATINYHRNQIILDEQTEQWQITG